jgi:PilZ domain
MSEDEKAGTPVTAVVASLPPSERRRNRRVKLSQPARLRPTDSVYAEEVQITLTVSRDGLYFTTPLKHYHAQMRVRVTFPYHPSDPVATEYLAEVVRVERLNDGRFGVAVRFLLR